MLTGSCEGLLWDPLLHGSAQREGMPQTQGSLEGLSPKLRDLGASGTPFALGEQWTKASSQGLLWEFWGAGEALSCHEFITFSDISMFSPFNFKKHQHIRKEVCPGTAAWMKVFVGQQRKLEELMCLPLTASSHGHPPKQCTHLERGGGGHVCLVGKIQLSRQTLHEARKERGRKRGQAGWRKHIPVCQVHCAI